MIGESSGVRVIIKQWRWRGKTFNIFALAPNLRRDAYYTTPLKNGIFPSIVFIYSLPGNQLETQ